MSARYFALEPPRQWQAGSIGGVPIYFNCGKCGAKEPPIAGVLAFCPPGSTTAKFHDVSILKTEGNFGNPAMFCRECFDRITAPQTR